GPTTGRVPRARRPTLCATGSSTTGTSLDGARIRPAMNGSLGPDPMSVRNEEGAVTGTSLQHDHEGYTLPAAAPPHNEGRTVAGWTMMAIVSLGVLVTCVGLIIGNHEVAWYAGP